MKVDLHLTFIVSTPQSEPLTSLYESWSVKTGLTPTPNNVDIGFGKNFWAWITETVDIRIVDYERFHCNSELTLAYALAWFPHVCRFSRQKRLSYAGPGPHSRELFIHLYKCINKPPRQASHSVRGDLLTALITWVVTPPTQIFKAAVLAISELNAH